MKVAEANPSKIDLAPFGPPVVGRLTQGSVFKDLCLQKADSQAELAQGLMGRAQIAPYDGMIFIFAGPDNWQFWMKDTLIPLKLLPIADDGKVIGAISMSPCTSDPCQQYSPGQPYAQALELPDDVFAGLEATFNMKEQLSFALIG